MKPAVILSISIALLLLILAGYFLFKKPSNTTILGENLNDSSDYVFDRYSYAGAPLYTYVGTGNALTGYKDLGIRYRFSYQGVREDGQPLYISTAS